MTAANDDSPDDSDIPDRIADDDVLDEQQMDLPVRIRGKDGAIRDYTIREMDPKQLQKWLRISAARFQKKGKAVKAGDADFDGLHEDLISLCLYDSTGGRVPHNVIASWGVNTKLRLFMKCRTHNGLDADVVEREGKG
jgi:hypothetical protein